MRGGEITEKFMRYTYIASDNAATNGTALGADNQDVRIYRIMFGKPEDGKVTFVYDKANPVASASTNIAFKHTQATHAAGTDFVTALDFGPDGLPLGEGGNVQTNASDVTVIWDFA